MNENVKTLHTWIEDCKPGRMVFFGGAGVSTESGIPDFRSPDGLYAQKYGDVPPEEMISRTYFDRHPEQFYEFYFDRMIAREAVDSLGEPDSEIFKRHYFLYQKTDEIAAVLDMNAATVRTRLRRGRERLREYFGERGYSCADPNF